MPSHFATKPRVPAQSEITSSPHRVPSSRVRELRRPYEEAGGGFFADRPLLAVQSHCDLARGGLRVADLDLAARDEPFLVEPVQEVAVVLRETHDRRVRPGFQIRQR